MPQKALWLWHSPLADLKEELGQRERPVEVRPEVGDGAAKAGKGKNRDFPVWVNESD